MGRSRSVRGTMEHPKDTRSALPFFLSWLERLDQSSTVTSSKTLFEDYRTFVTIKTSRSHKLSFASDRRFYRQFASKARSRNFDYVASQRGYKVAIPGKMPRTVKSDVSMSEKARLFLERGESEFYVEPKWIDTTQGRGLFAKRDITCETPVDEYIGQVISMDVAADRDRQYARSGRDPRIISLPNQLAFDGYCKPDGSPCDPLLNYGALMNHSRQSPNCKLVRVGCSYDIRIVMCTTEEVSAGEQLKWDYSDNRKGLPSWIYH